MIVMAEVTEIFHDLDSNGDLELILNFNRASPDCEAPVDDEIQVERGASEPNKTLNSRETFENEHVEQEPLDDRSPSTDPIERSEAEETGNEVIMDDPPPEEADGLDARPSVRFRVSSRHLILASGYFKRMLEGPWRESLALRSGGCPSIPLEEQDDKNFLILLKIFHGYSIKVPLDISIDDLLKIVALVDLYECADAVYIYGLTWMKSVDEPTNYEPESVMRHLWMSWVFKQSQAFFNMTCLLAKHSLTPIDTFDFPIPNRIISKISIPAATVLGINISKDRINDQRQNNKSRIFNATNDYLASLERPEMRCSFECDAKMSGATRKQLRPLGFLIVQEEPVFSRISLHSIIARIRTCKPAAGYIGYMNCDCKILAPVISEIDTIEKESLGFTLEDLLIHGRDKSKANPYAIEFPSNSVKRLTLPMLARGEQMMNKMSEELQTLRAARLEERIREFSYLFSGFCDACLWALGNSGRMVCHESHSKLNDPEKNLDEFLKCHANTVISLCTECYEAGWRCSVEDHSPILRIPKYLSCERLQMISDPITCGRCKLKISKTYLHCCSCKEFNICLACTLAGETCLRPGREGHKLIGQYIPELDASEE